MNPSITELQYFNTKVVHTSTPISMCSNLHDEAKSARCLHCRCRYHIHASLIKARNHVTTSFTDQFTKTGPAEQHRSLLEICSHYQSNVVMNSELASTWDGAGSSGSSSSSWSCSSSSLSWSNSPSRSWRASRRHRVGWE